ncbi:phosphatidate cytidylyltransferase [Sphingomonas naphthae]|uniref:Phosphatidate cytidylyltransferase n=1 Tax=Sphingomonas naphthae TaxID=1813468 RepID=A0ABY7TPN5_9SPHN|nr:phosphatidate cytidylyltransferase [Sphingomonas naphthae]WCT75073.1 phosphatidate cytidylyltransferase [Sphingomonas naphthae]
MTAALARSSDLNARLVTGVALIVVAVAALWLGGVVFWLLASVAAMLMVAEWAGLAHASQGRIRLSVAAMILPIALACPLLWGAERDTVAVLGIAGIMVAIVTGQGRLGLGLLFAGLPTIGLMYLRGLPNGALLTLWALAIVWATDTGAYFAGRAIGGPKLAPRVSPSKTWAGLGGGVVAAGLVGLLIAALAGLPAPLRWLGAPMALLAQSGDLFESWLKRRAGVKDSGRFLPGHGGALDRLDGVVPVATLIAALFAGGAL